MKKCLILVFVVFLLSAFLSTAGISPEEDCCTSVTAGRLATRDGSVMTSHTCDSRVTRTWIDVAGRENHSPGALRNCYLKSNQTVSAYDLSRQELVGTIPQAAVTYKYFNTALPPLNENQVAIGESTFGGREEMKSENGVIDYYELNRIMAERAKTARHAIQVMDELTQRYGYIGGGECFTIADPHEVWHLEIIGPGKGKKGSVWVAQRVPDDHISVNANAARIRAVDLSRPDYFMASDNYRSRAIEMGLYDPQSKEPFEFCYVYGSRRSMAARRREWRVFTLLAPSLDLDPNGENFPFSVKPDEKIGPEDIMEVFRDTYEDTPFDMTKYMLVPELDENGKRTGKLVKSPYANPFMHYDMMPLLKVNGGWNELGERTIARYYCTYATVIQVRSWLPDEIGGLIWFGYDNPAMTAYAPIYAGVEELPESFKICGRPGFNRNSAWWAFNRVADLSAQKWGEMRHDVRKVWEEAQKTLLSGQKEIEQKALELYRKNPRRARRFLTEYTNRWLKKLTGRYWKLGDELWSKYTGKF